MRQSCIHTSQLLIEQPASGELPEEDGEDNVNVKRQDIKYTLEYIDLLKEATLEMSGLAEDEVHRLRNPMEEEFDITDPVIRLSIDLYLALSNASLETYNLVRDAIATYSPDIKVLTLYKVRAIH